MKVVRLSLFDVLGRKVTLFINENLNAGRYKVSWDDSGYPSGVYFYKLITNDFVDVKKMVLLK